MEMFLTFSFVCWLLFCFFFFGEIWSCCLVYLGLFALLVGFDAKCMFQNCSALIVKQVLAPESIRNGISELVAMFFVFFSIMLFLFSWGEGSTWHWRCLFYFLCFCFQKTKVFVFGYVWKCVWKGSKAMARMGPPRPWRRRAPRGARWKAWGLPEWFTL